MRNTKLLWTIQGLLAALFLFAGVVKLVLPAATLQTTSTLAVPFLRFIGAAEVLGAIGLVLPGLLRIAKQLTPLAAIGLVTIMSGATVLTIEGGQIGAAAVPFVVGILAASVVYGRRAWVPSRI